LVCPGIFRQKANLVSCFLFSLLVSSFFPHLNSPCGTPALIVA
jgi:hypothetical protein